MRPSLLLLAASVGLGSYLIADDERPVPSPPPATKPARTAAIPAFQPSLPAAIDDEPVLAADEPADVVEPIRGHDPISDPAELAMVFTVGDETFVQLSTSEHARSHGTPEMNVHDGVTSVIAPVAASALPAKFRGWANRSVLVNGTCEARVVGFAEVSRIGGDASDPYAYDDDGNRIEPDEWTDESVRAENITLAAKLDGNCAGTWARASDFTRAAVATPIEAPALTDAALAHFEADVDDEMKQSWVEQGGHESTAWRDQVDVATRAFTHPLTNETWIFVQLRREGTCGDISLAAMAAYRARPDGKLHQATRLDLAYETIDHAVDLDGDGQLELVLGDGASASVVDLKSTHHDTVSIPFRHYGCSC